MLFPILFHSSLTPDARTRCEDKINQELSITDFWDSAREFLRSKKNYILAFFPRRPVVQVGEMVGEGGGGGSVEPEIHSCFQHRSNFVSKIGSMCPDL